MAQYVSRKHVREGAGDRDRRWRGGGEKDGEKAERRRKSLLSAETERHTGTKWAGHWGFLEALPTQHICCRRAKWANALDSETDS